MRSIATDTGKHVLIEKPFTISAAEATEVIGVAAERNLVVMEAMWTRFLMEGLARRGDVLLALSTSGQSANLLRCLERARDIDVSSVALLGKGGAAAAIESVPIVIGQ